MSDDNPNQTPLSKLMAGTADTEKDGYSASMREKLHRALNRAADASHENEYVAFTVEQRAQMGFSLVMNGGRNICVILYHQLGIPEFAQEGEEEVLSFTAHGRAVTMQGKGLRPLLYAIKLHQLVEAREYSGQKLLTAPSGTRIDRIEVDDAISRGGLSLVKRDKAAG